MENTLLIEDARIVFRNFKGAEGMYNREGDRNFAVLIDDPEMEQKLKDDGWNVKYLKPRDDEDSEQAYLQVSVNFNGRPPTVAMISSKGKEHLDEHTVELLDYVDIRQVDMILNPYNWAVNGKSGIKAYLKSLFVTIEEDALDRKYADIPDAQSSVADDIEKDSWSTDEEPDF